MTIDSAGSKSSRIVAALQEKRFLTTRQLQALGISREYLRQMTDDGRVERATRGLYRLPGPPVDPHHDIAQVAAKVPYGVMCLSSALRLHGVTTPAAAEVWLAVESHDWCPRHIGVPVRFIRPRVPAFRQGIEQFEIEGLKVQAYCLAKTLAECFRYRNKIGVEVGVEALREVLGAKRASIDEIWHYAKLGRVTNSMGPHLEAMK